MITDRRTGRFVERGDPEKRFWLRVYARGDCWEFRGGHGAYGHGLFNPGGLDGQVLAHRWAYESTKGPIPPGLVVDHRCGHGWCVRPSHLVAVTRRENTTRLGSRAPTALNRAKTHYKRGHPFTAVWRGHRICRACQRLWARKKLGLKRPRVLP